MMIKRPHYELTTSRKFSSLKGGSGYYSRLRSTDCNPGAYRGRQTQGSVPLWELTLTQRSSLTGAEGQFYTDIFEVVVLHVLMSVFSTLVDFQTCYLANTFILNFLLGSPWHPDELFFNLYTIKFILCSAQFYEVWQVCRVKYSPPQCHIEHSGTLKITQCSLFIENLSLSPQTLATTDLFSIPMDVPFPWFYKDVIIQYVAFSIWLLPLLECTSESSMLLCVNQ